MGPDDQLGDEDAPRDWTTAQPSDGPGGEHVGFAMDVPAGSPRVSPSGYLLDALRRRRLGKRVLSTLTAVLFLAGAGMFAYPFFTDVYTNQVVQQRLEDEFTDLQVQTFDEWQSTVEVGRALTKIAIPAIGVETLVVEGTSPAALRAGAGHYPNTPLPGQSGNVAIAGHRTTYGRPFNRLDQVGTGDAVWLITPVGEYEYAVSEVPEGWSGNPYVTGPKDWQVIEPTVEPSLTLTTCHPKGSAAQRLVLRATLVASHAPGTYASSAA